MPELVSDNTFKRTNNRVKCIGAETDFYTTGAIYDVFLKVEDTKGKYVQGKDGIFDRIGNTLSKFKAVNK